MSHFLCRFTIGHLLHNLLNHCRKAYEVACLGVTEGDWHTLAHAALEGLHIPIAKKSFTHIRDLIYLDLISSIEVPIMPIDVV